MAEDFRYTREEQTEEMSDKIQNPRKEADKCSIHFLTSADAGSVRSYWFVRLHLLSKSFVLLQTSDRK